MNKPEAALEFDLELDRFVANLEQAGGAPSVEALERFAPPCDHPRYRDILIELMRVDMELAFERGEVRSAEAYWEQFRLSKEGDSQWKVLCSEEQRLKASPRSDKSPSPARSDLRGMPKPGEEVCGFRILGELGSGAFSRVFLANDLRLANREVVLKFSRHFPGEAQVLSRLQHKNIVPIYSWHRHGEYHVVCMPYSGGTTLAELLRGVFSDGSNPSSSTQAPLTGKALINTLDARASRTWRKFSSVDPSSLSQQAASVSQDKGMSTEDQESPSGDHTQEWQRIGLRNLELTDRLSKLDATRTALWIASELAEGLHHAHSRQILHRDIKPANVLLTDEGLPMLLDFNLAQDQRNDWMEEGLGGTLRYMSPEQLLGLLSSKSKLDARSDIYSLGMVLYELLYHRACYPDQTKLDIHGEVSDAVVLRLLEARQVPPPLPIDPRQSITPAVTAILEKCLHPNADERYATAEQLCTDLRLQLGDAPLRYAPNRSIQEKLVKWNRRHPRWSVSTIGLAIGVLLVSISGAMIAQSKYRLLRSEAKQWKQEGTATRSMARSLLAGPGTPRAQLKEVIDRCDEWLSPLTTESRLARLASQDRSEAEDLLAQMKLFRARGTWRLAATSDESTALQLLASTIEDCTAVSSVPSRQAELARLLLNFAQEAQSKLQQGMQLKEAFSMPEVLPPNFIADEILLARDAATMEASNPWYWIGLAQLQYEAGEKQQAMSSARTAMQLDESMAWAHYLVGLIHCEAKQFREAKKHFGNALLRKPNLVEAQLNRAIACVGLGEWEAAIRDLDQLEAKRESFPRLFFIREIAKRAMGRSEEAEADRTQGLEAVALDALGWNAQGEAWLRNANESLVQQSAERALQCFQKAIHMDPSLRNAYENLAHVHSEKLGNHDAAIDTLGHAISRFPDYALAWSSRSVLLARRGESEKALSDGERALALERSPMVCYQVASALSLLTDSQVERSRSFELLRDSLRQDPSLARWMNQDPDLHAWHDDPDFRSLLDAARMLRP